MFPERFLEQDFLPSFQCYSIEFSVNLSWTDVLWKYIYINDYENYEPWILITKSHILLLQMSTCYQL